MQPKEIIEKLRLTFNELVNNQQPIQLATAKLMDGTEIEVTELAVGGIVTIQGVPAPVGEHQLEDGTILVVGDNGAITEIKTAMPEEPPMQEDMATMFSAFQTSTNEKFAAYEQKFADYEVKLNKANSIIDALLEVTKTLAETPTGTPDQAIKTQNNFKEEKIEKNYAGLFS